MKKRYINLLTVVLSTTVLLGGCGATKIYSASAADSSEMSSLISGDSAGRRSNMEARVRIRRAEQMNENEKKKSRDKDLKSGEPPKSGLLHEACPPVPVKIRHSLRE